MNRKIKAISAALLAAAMCASFTGCADNEKPESGDSKTETDTTESVNQSSAEGEPESESTADSSSTDEEPADKQKDITLALTDEIKNAALDSGLVQCFNEVYQDGGYVTVGELIKKTKSLYDFKYNSEPLTEDTLNTMINPNIDRETGEANFGYLNYNPKFTVNGEDVGGYWDPIHFVNPSDKPIPLSECYVHKFCGRPRAMFFPGGFGENLSLATYFLTEDAKKEQKNLNYPNYIETDIAEYLKSLGFEEIKTNVRSDQIEAKMENNKKFYVNKYGNYFFFIVGEPNAFGARPFYRNAIGYSGKLRCYDTISYIFE